MHAYTEVTYIGAQTKVDKPNTRRAGRLQGNNVPTVSIWRTPDIRGAPSIYSAKKTFKLSLLPTPLLII